MAKCDGCGRDNVNTQIIEVDGHNNWVCPRCYVLIKESQAYTLKSLSSVEAQNAFEDSTLNMIDNIRKMAKQDGEVLDIIIGRLKSLEKRIAALEKRGSQSMEPPIELKALAKILEKHFPKQVNFLEDQGIIWVMDKVGVTRDGVVEGKERWCAKETQRIYENYVNTLSQKRQEEE